MLDCTTISKAFAVPWKERNTKFFLKSLQPKHVCGLKQDRKAEKWLPCVMFPVPAPYRSHHLGFVRESYKKMVFYI